MYSSKDVLQSRSRPSRLSCQGLSGKRGVANEEENFKTIGSGRISEVKKNEWEKRRRMKKKGVKRGKERGERREVNGDCSKKM